MKTNRSTILGALLVVVIVVMCVGAWWLIERAPAEPNAGEEATPSESLDPIASETAPATSGAVDPEDWEPAVEAATEAADPNAVAEGVRQALMDSDSSEDAAALLHDMASPNLTWSVSTANLEVFQAAQITEASQAEVGSETTSVTFSGVSPTGQSGALFTVTLAQGQTSDEGGGDGLTGTYIATHVDLGEVLAETGKEPLPFSLESEADALEVAEEGVNVLVDPATHDLTDEQRQEVLSRYFADSESAMKIGPVVNSEGRAMTTEQTSSSTWITQPDANPQAFLYGAWVDPLDSNLVGGWNYAVTFTRNDDGEIVPERVNLAEDIEGAQEDVDAEPEGDHVH